MRRASAELPYGASILPAIMSRDPTARWLQIAQLAGTVVGTAMIVPTLSTRILPAVLGLDAGFDGRHGVQGFLQLLRGPLGLAASDVLLAAGVTVGAFAALFAADVLLGVRWPRSWDTENRGLCYEEMFCEPKRPGALVRRLGNTYSNALYLFGGLVVLMSCGSSVFWAADALFGAMLLILSALSVCWHASNAEKSQYLDLWAMDSCIFYLIVRVLFLGAAVCAQWALPARHGALAAAAAAWGCFAAFASLVRHLVDVKCGPSFAHLRGPGPFDKVCPSSGRSRLLNEGSQSHRASTGSRTGRLRTSGVCLFWGMPVLYLVPAALVQWAAGSIGSGYAASMTGASLAAGWSLRMFERFVLDGWWPMNALAPADAVPGTLGPRRLLAAAAVSPTAFLHWFTGVTLLSGYIWVRTLEQASLG